MKPSAVATDIDRLCVNTLRFLAVDGVEKADSGHPGAPMEAAALGYVLWTRVLDHDPRNPRWPNRDRFVLSAGHASMLLYGLLHLTGYDLTLDDLKKFRQWDSRTPGHPENFHTPGVETTTGPLGQGFANGVGMALAERHLAARYNRPGLPLVDHFTWGFVSDGDLMEGVAAEAASLAGHLKLGKLKYVYLDNKITIEGSTALTFSEDVQRRFEAYGWEVLRLDDAEDVPAIEAVLKKARSQTERPTLVIARTHIGFGSPNKQDTAEAHGSPLGKEEAALAKKALGWPESPVFHVPPEALAVYRRCLDRAESLVWEWNALWERYKLAFPEPAAEWDRLARGVLPDGWEAKLPSFPAGASLATRQASGQVLAALSTAIPALIGGSADLAPSTSTLVPGGDFSAQNGAGRNLRFGIREHAMGAVCNGLALEGLIPYAATFLVFTDYMKASMRLAALMRLGVVYVMTHDSVGLGEDGPTHQPVEQLAGLRAVPNLAVFRPADAAETAYAWRAAVARRTGPTVLALSRQKLPVLDRARFAPAEGTLRGGYVLSPAPAVGKEAAAIVATGSEVALALRAQEALAAKGTAARVVSLPCWELFDAQDDAYRESVLPAALTARVAVEAGASLGWHKYVGPRGGLVTLDRFGASAPGGTALEKLGFNVENVARTVLAALER